MQQPRSRCCRGSQRHRLPATTGTVAGRCLRCQWRMFGWSHLQGQSDFGCGDTNRHAIAEQIMTARVGARFLRDRPNASAEQQEPENQSRNSFSCSQQAVRSGRPLALRCLTERRDAHAEIPDRPCAFTLDCRRNGIAIPALANSYGEIGRYARSKSQKRPRGSEVAAIVKEIRSAIERFSSDFAGIRLPDQRDFSGLL